MCDHGMAALLVLNKADLVPVAAAEAWRGWFECRYPGLKVGGLPGGGRGEERGVGG